MKREIPIIVTLIFTLTRFGFEMFDKLAKYEIAPGKLLFTRVSNSITFLYYVGLFLGLINLTLVHTHNIKRRKENWPFSVWLLIVLYGYTLLGIFGGLKNTAFNWIYDGVIVPCIAPGFLDTGLSIQHSPSVSLLPPGRRKVFAIPQAAFCSPNVL